MKVKAASAAMAVWYRRRLYFFTIVINVLGSFASLCPPRLCPEGSLARYIQSPFQPMATIKSDPIKTGVGERQATFLPKSGAGAAIFPKAAATRQIQPLYQCVHPPGRGGKQNSRLPRRQDRRIGVWHLVREMQLCDYLHSGDPHAVPPLSKRVMTGQLDSRSEQGALIDIKALRRFMTVRVPVRGRPCRAAYLWADRPHPQDPRREAAR